MKLLERHYRRLFSRTKNEKPSEEKSIEQLVAEGQNAARERTKHEVKLIEYNDLARELNIHSRTMDFHFALELFRALKKMDDRIKELEKERNDA